MHYGVTLALKKKLQKIQRKQPLLAAKIQKQLNIFETNEKHPSLNNHKLKGNLDNIWCIYIDESIRMTYFFENDEAIFFKVGTHDEVYQRN